MAEAPAYPAAQGGGGQPVAFEAGVDRLFTIQGVRAGGVKQVGA